MKKKLLIIGIVLIGSLSSCSSEKKVEEKKESEVTHVVEDIDGLALNDGKKWIANSETHEGMTQIKVILDNMDSLTLEDYNLMGDKCNEQTSFIISNCSMDGEAHNQLHHVLHPILDDIDSLMHASTIDDCKAAVSSLENNLLDYFAHFEI
jgi:hypothetical protein